jgi:hypothetical protein
MVLTLGFDVKLARGLGLPDEQMLVLQFLLLQGIAI